MIKAKGYTGDGRPLLLFGLSGENVARLVAGEPVSFDLTELNLPPTQVVICYGATEQELQEQVLAEGLGRFLEGKEWQQ